VTTASPVDLRKAPRWFYEGKCQEKYFPSELRPGRKLVVAFSPRSLAICRCVLLPWIIGPDQREGGRGLMISTAWLSLLMGSVVQNGPERSRARR
jgi:hypothetical protein